MRGSSRAPSARSTTRSWSLPSNSWRRLPKLIWHEDEPIAFPSSVPLYFVSRLARQHVKVVLTGEGADELFLGYDYRYRVTALNDRIGRVYWNGVPRFIRRRIPVPCRCCRCRSNAMRLEPHWPTNPGPVGCSSTISPCFPNRCSSRYCSRAGRWTPVTLMPKGYVTGMSIAARLLERMSYADVATHLVELLMKQDQMSMAASLESRVPYLDHQLVEQAMQVPGSQRMRRWQTKVVLREALRTWCRDRPHKTQNGLPGAVRFVGARSVPFNAG